MRQEALSREEIAARLGPVFRAHGVRRAVLFGSCAKGTADEQSDVDILVDSGLRGLSFFGLLDSAAVALDERRIDLIDVRELRPGSRLGAEIDATGVEIYAG